MAFTCNFCLKVYTNKCSFSRHRKTHTRPVSYECGCGKTYKRKDYLLSHQKTEHPVTSIDSPRRVQHAGFMQKTANAVEAPQLFGKPDDLTDFLDETWINIQDSFEQQTKCLNEDLLINLQDDMPVHPNVAAWRANTPPLGEYQDSYNAETVLNSAAFTLHHLAKYKLTKMFRFYNL